PHPRPTLKEPNVSDDSAIEPGALDDITPDQFADMMKTSSDEDVLQAIRTVGTGQVLGRVFKGFEERFLADKASGVEAVMQFVVADEGDAHHHVVTIRDGSCTASPGQADDPRVTLRLGLLDFLKLVSGQANGPALFMAGKLKIQGDLMFAPRIMSYFEVPS
ncbi:MAG: SCP2 sterol-binding domain-containing protein, partial [Actinobacteria bacterium]|nr:SCP2 sterol-binding domain-containing protein [Actinomycetota bacterium]